MGRVPSRGSEQFVLRMPDGMRDRLRSEAEANGRSMNAEIVDRLEKSLRPGEQVLAHELLQNIIRLTAGSGLRVTIEETSPRDVVQRSLNFNPEVKNDEGEE